MESFLAQIIMFAGNFAPRGWAYCNGQLLSINQYSALYSLLGNTYGHQNWPVMKMMAIRMSLLVKILGFQNQGRLIILRQTMPLLATEPYLEVLVCKETTNHLMFRIRLQGLIISYHQKEFSLQEIRNKQIQINTLNINNYG